MTEKSVFDFDDYKAYLHFRWSAAGARSGVKQKAAQYINCQTTYISQVLKQRAHFSLEQAEKLNHFLQHTSEESHFFLLLVQKGRSGTLDLSKYFEEQIDEIVQKRNHVSGRVGSTSKISEQMISDYYARWVPLAIHVAVSIPALKTREALCEYFGLDADTVQDTLELLLKAGAISKDGNLYSHKQGLTHLSHKSPLIVRHHSNWRLEALKALDQSQETDLNYAVVYSLSRETAEKLRKKFVTLIEENLKEIGPSREEVIYCNIIDFFEVRRGPR